MKKLYINKIHLKILILTVFSGTVSSAFSQNRYLFINQHTVYEKFEPIATSNNVYHAVENKPFNYSIFSITLSKTKNRKFSEFTFMPLSVFTKKVQTDYINLIRTYHYEWLTVQSHFSYHSSYLLREDKKVMPYVGWGVKVYGNLQENVPVVSSIFYKEVYTYGLQGIFIIGVKTKLSNRLYFNAQLPYSFFDYSVNNDYLGSPLLTREQKKKKYNSLKPFPSSFYFKVGVGLLLKNRKDEKVNEKD